MNGDDQMLVIVLIFPAIFAAYLCLVFLYPLYKKLTAKRK